jgi:hypothetical protein
MKNLKKINMLLTAFAAVLFLTAGDWIGSAFRHHANDPAKFIQIDYFSDGTSLRKELKCSPGLYYTCTLNTCTWQSDPDFCACLPFD